MFPIRFGLTKKKNTTILCRQNNPISEVNISLIWRMTKTSVGVVALE